MTAERGFALHPLAAQDITEIWEYIAEDNPLAARRVRDGGTEGLETRALETKRG
jgi:plasmid stabilization system protein ParE